MAFASVCGRVREALTRATAMRGQTSSKARAKRDTRSSRAPKPHRRKLLVCAEEPNPQHADGCVVRCARWSPTVDVVWRAGTEPGCGRPGSGSRASRQFTHDRRRRWRLGWCRGARDDQASGAGVRGRGPVHRVHPGEVEGCARPLGGGLSHPTPALLTTTWGTAAAGKALVGSLRRTSTQAPRASAHVPKPDRGGDGPPPPVPRDGPVMAEIAVGLNWLMRSSVDGSTESFSRGAPSDRRGLYERIGNCGGLHLTGPIV